MQQLARLFFALLLKLVLVLCWVCSAETHAQGTSIRVNSDNGKTTIRFSNGISNSFHLEFEGEITLSDDDRDIVAISRGGYLEIKKSAFGNRRRIFMEADGSGKLIKKYFVGGSEKPFEQEGRQWLAEILPEILRSSTIAAEQRVDRMYGKGGTRAVLREVDYMDSDYVKSYYIKLLLNKNPKNSDLIPILEVVGDDIDSDHHKAEILKHNTKGFLATEASTAAYIKAAEQIDSDHHMAEVLKKAVRDNNISQPQMKELFSITKEISSDHHKAEVLMTVLQNRSLSSANVNLLINASKDISSDHHRARVLKSALGSSGLSERNYKALLQSIDGINSDHHTASVFNQLLNKPMDGASLSEFFILVDDSMSSNYHQASVLKKAIEKQNIDDRSLTALINTIRDINSDNHKADVLKQLAKKRFEAPQLIRILQATSSLGSDYHQATALQAFAPAVRGSGSNVKDAYRKACDGISSGSHYAKTVRAINN